MQKFDTPAPISAVLDIPAGSVQFIAADRADTVVEILPTDASKARDVKAVEQTTVEYADGVLRIHTSAKNQYFGPSGSLEVTVHLPTDSRVEAKAASAKLRSAGRLGDITFDGAYSQIKIDKAAAVNLTAVDGDVEVAHLNGPAQITTTRGDIKITEAVRGKVVLSTQSGAISVGAAPGVSATLDAGTSYGRITNTLKNAEGPTANLNIHATTAHGNITAHSL
nr:DUF4097 family beta strand repeat-containing protein [Kibdelosporangium sp. MJ126-NF4]